MAEKDITEKILEAYNDVFADIVNVLLFNGRDVIKPDELVEQAPRTAYKADGKIREIERDVAKRWLKQNIRIACVGFENQTAVDPDMPIRVIGYDGAEYRSELANDKKDENGKIIRAERYPVVTLVLYFGYKKHWDKPTNLLGCFNVPEEFKPYVNDYKMHLFEIAYLSDEQVKLFHSDFRVVADYFVQMRKNRDYVPDPVKIKHVQETLELLSVMTGDHRYEDSANDAEKGEPENMCEVLDRIETKGRTEGRAEGINTGKILGFIEACRDDGLSDDATQEKIMRRFHLTPDVAKEYLALETV